MNEQLENLFDTVTAGEWGNNQGTEGGIDTGVIRSANFTKNHQFNTKEIVIRSIEGRKRQKKLLCHGDILIEKSGGSPDQPVGRVLFYDLHGEHTCSNFISILRPSQQADPKFLYYSLCNLYERGVVKNYQQQTTGIINLQLGEYLRESIFFPPLPEQKKIAEILSGIDEQIKRTRCQIAHFKKLGNATTKNLLGSLQDEMMPLSEVSINHDSRRVPIKSEERATRKGPYRYYGASGVIDTIDDFLFDGNYILIGEDGANIIDRNKPLAFRVSGRFWVNNHAHIIQPREFCDINFLTHYLESLDYTGIASGSAQPKITRSALDSILIPVPTMEVQKKIGSAVESIISSASNAECKENKLLDLKQAIAADLLSGRKRVSV